MRVQLFQPAPEDSVVVLEAVDVPVVVVSVVEDPVVVVPVVAVEEIVDDVDPVLVDLHTHV